MDNAHGHTQIHEFKIRESLKIKIIWYCLRKSLVVVAVWFEKKNILKKQDWTTSLSSKPDFNVV